MINKKKCKIALLFYNIYGDYIMQEYNLIDIENLVQNLYNKFNIEIPSIEYYKLLRFYQNEIPPPLQVGGEEVKLWKKL